MLNIWRISVQFVQSIGNKQLQESINWRWDNNGDGMYDDKIGSSNGFWLDALILVYDVYNGLCWDLSWDMFEKDECDKQFNLLRCEVCILERCFTVCV